MNLKKQIPVYIHPRMYMYES